MIQEQNPGSMGALLKDDERARNLFHRIVTRADDGAGGTLSPDEAKDIVGDALGITGSENLKRRFGPNIGVLIREGFLAKIEGGDYEPTDKARQAAGEVGYFEVPLAEGELLGQEPQAGGDVGALAEQHSAVRGLQQELEALDQQVADARQAVAQAEAALGELKQRRTDAHGRLSTAVQQLLPDKD
ncbi:MAG: hypothetical protein WD850_01230 [Candidatus Spechtbacterales bacterium]